MERHGDRLHRLALRLCPTEAEADDLVQETMIAALAAWPSFKGESRPYTWLFRIAARTCARMQRKRAGEPDRLLPLDEILGSGSEGSGSAAPPMAAPGGRAWTALERQEVRRRLDRALAEVPRDFRMALVLKDIADFSLDEIGEILEIGAATAKTRVHRGRIHLRRALGEQGALPPLPPPSDVPRQVCLDLLAAKLDAMDRGVDFPLPHGEICDRCAALFRSLDLAQDACATLRGGAIPARLKRRLDALLPAR
jgi:RNA polymerase sigma-70 factor (ECF subfamily)